jgi:hypothetical protein
MSDLIEVQYQGKNSRLFNGHKYLTDKFENTRNYGGDIHILTHNMVDMGHYRTSMFKLSNGNDLPSIKFDITIDSGSGTLNPGDIVVCRNSGRYKYLVEGGFYRINSAVDEYPGRSYWNSYLVKFEGYNREFKWNDTSFRKLTKKETRNITLSSIFNKPENFTVEFIRKLDQFDNTNKALIDVIGRSIADKKRHGVGVVDWILSKSEKDNMGVVREDLEDILKRPLGELLEEYDRDCGV